MDNKILGYREYTALFYLSKGNIVAFKELLVQEVPLMYETSLDRLQHLEYIEIKGSVIILTPKSIKLLVNKNEPESIGCEKWFKEFRSQFEPNRMGTENEIIIELNKFIRKYKFTQEEIVNGTKEYIKKTAESNHKYQLKAENFITKELKNYCEFIKQQETTRQVSFNGKLMD